MKKNFWLMIGVLISTSVLADGPLPPATATATTNAVPADMAPAAAVPAAAATAHHASKPAHAKSTHTAKKAPELRTVPLVPGPAVVAANNVNVRGKPSIKGEVITRMTNGESVTVIEEVHLTLSAADEPSAWAKIVVPDKVHPWVNATFLDQSTMTVKVKKLNLRGGPGENFSVLGTLQQGNAVKEVSRKGDWMEIEGHPSAFAFMAAQYLKQEPPTAVVSTEPTTATNVTDAAIVAAAATETPLDALAATNQMAMGGTNEAGATPVVEEPPPPRIVQREGIVRGTFSIQAPTKYELISQENHKTINYLYTTSPGLDLSRYKGLHIIVTGEEGLDERWGNTPVLTIQKIQVLD